MTIALGILAADGVVLAADSEYTWGYLKTSGEKIWTAEAHGAMAIAGAGSADYAEAVSLELLDVFTRTKAGVTVAGLEKRLRSTLLEFHAKHVVPFSAFPSDETAVWLIIGLQRDGKSYLWATSKGTLRPRRPYAAIGYGTEYTHALLSAIFDTKDRALTGVELAKRLAGYVVYETKRHVQNCGQSTSVVMLKDGRVVEVNGSTIQLLDSYCDRYAATQALALKYALGFPYKDQLAASANLAKYFLSLRSDMLKSEALQFEGRGLSLE
jgi:20S proteasome alpha/beta subunit